MPALLRPSTSSAPICSFLHFKGCGHQLCVKCALYIYSSCNVPSESVGVPIEKYAQAIYNVTVDVENKLAKSMRLEGDHLFEGWPCQFRINQYNFTPETVGSLGVQMHTDSGFLTVLQGDENVAGLEVKDQFGKFVVVDPLPGTLVVNLGDVGTVLNLIL